MDILIIDISLLKLSQIIILLDMLFKGIELMRNLDESQRKKC